jgi:hypothetical protein
MNRPMVMSAALSELQKVREKMRASGVGEPAVEIPLDHLHTFVGEHGERKVILCMDKLIDLVDRALRQ